MQRRRVLIADHHQDHAQVLRKLLVGAGYEVRTAADGEQALHDVEVFQPHLVYADARLPVVDGPHLVNEIRARFKSPPVLIVLAADAGGVEDRIHYMSLDIDDFLVRPFDLDEFSARLEILFQEYTALESAPKPERRGFSGNLSEMSLVDLLQALEVGEKTGVLRIHQNGREGRVYFREGQVIDAEVDDLEASKALHRLFTWSEGSFFVELRPVDRAPAIEGPNRRIWTEGLSRLDRWQKFCRQLPPLYYLVARNEALSVDELDDSQMTLWAQLSVPKRLIDVVYESPLEDLEALQRLAELLEQGKVTALPAEEVPGNGNLPPFLHRHQGSQPGQRIRELIASVFRRQEATQREVCEDHPSTERRQSGDRRKQPRRRDEQKREKNNIYLTRSELLMIRERLLQG